MRDFKKIQRVTQDDDDHLRSQTDHIPLDIILEILSRLPTKSIVRFFCVSKLWSSFITLPSFINSFASRSSAQPPRLMTTFIFEAGKHFVVSFPQNQNPDGSYSPVCSYQITNPDDHRICSLSVSVHGLILLPEFEIWNPTLRRVLTLPRPHPKEHVLSRYCRSYLGYDPLEGKHKVLYLSVNEDSLQSLVLTLGDQESWRMITKNTPIHRPDREGRQCINGSVLYYKAHVDDKNIIMSFDCKSESFSLIKYPEGLFRFQFHMIFYEGRLALVTETFLLHDIDLFNIDLYILKDAHGHEWTHQRLHFKSNWRTGMEFKGITDGGELIFAPFCFSEAFYILYFDPRRNSTREALFEGLMGAEFKRRYGIFNKYIQTMGVFPNHIESLVSL